MDMHQLLSTVQQTGTPRGENKGEDEAEDAEEAVARVANLLNKWKAAFLKQCGEAARRYLQSYVEGSALMHLRGKARLLGSPSRGRSRRRRPSSFSEAGVAMGRSALGAAAAGAGAGAGRGGSPHGGALGSSDGRPGSAMSIDTSTTSKTVDWDTFDVPGIMAAVEYALERCEEVTRVLGTFTTLQGNLNKVRGAWRGAMPLPLPLHQLTALGNCTQQLLLLAPQPLPLPIAALQRKLKALPLRLEAALRASGSSRSIATGASPRGRPPSGSAASGGAASPRARRPLRRPPSGPTTREHEGQVAGTRPPRRAKPSLALPPTKPPNGRGHSSASPVASPSPLTPSSRLISVCDPDDSMRWVGTLYKRRYACVRASGHSMCVGGAAAKGAFEDAASELGQMIVEEWEGLKSHK